MNPYILHHSLGSPYAEKMRVLLGHLGIPWRGVCAPKGVPRPVQQALAGAYARRIPILQRGADIILDSGLMTRVLAEQAPEAALFPAECSDRDVAFRAEVETASTGCMLTALSAREFVVGYLRALPLRDALVFLRDRAGLAKQLPARPRDVAGAREDAQVYLQRLEQRLAATGDMLGQGHRTASDFAAFTMVWYHQRLNRLRWAGDAPHLRRWLEGMQSLDRDGAGPVSSDEALAQARDARPAPLPPGLTRSPHLGRTCRIRPNDLLGTIMEDVHGVLVGEDTHRVVVRAEHAVGTVHVHAPRAWSTLDPRT